MSRSCACQRLLDTLKTDMRLRALPLSVRCLWLLLVDALASQPEPGVFMMGSRPGSDAEIALAVSASETEVKPALETLVAVGLLERRADGAIVVPDLPQARRAAQNRQNGGLGGRPRAGETADQARQRRQQGSFMLPIQGGGGETQGNRKQTETRLAGARGLPATAEEEEAAKPREVSAEEAQGLAAELAAVARFGPGVLWHGGPVANWLRMPGVTADVLRAGFAEVAGRASYRPPGAGFGYFERMVPEWAARARDAAPALAGPGDERHRRFHAAAERWMADPRGPQPVLADFMGAA